MREGSGENLVFIVGAPRSGTTWLQIVLSQSPEIVTSNETHLFSGYLLSLFTSWANFHGSSRALGLHHVMSEEQFLQYVKEFSDNVFGELRKRNPNARIILEKTPAHGRYWRHIVRVYPAASFVHLIRDPRSVVASLSAAGRSWGKNWANTGTIYNARLWRDDVTSARQIRDAGARYHEILYEDLYSNGAPTLKAVCDFLGIQASMSDCDAWLQASEIGNLKSCGAKSVVPWGASTEPANFFRRGGSNWQEELPRDTVAVIENIAAPLMKDLGYEAAERGRRPLKYRGLQLLLALVEGIGWRIRDLPKKI